MLQEQLVQNNPARPIAANTRRSHTKSASYRPDIEGLRGIAILLVVVFHAGIPICQGGFLGVDVFFVLSGYLITGLLENEVLQTGRLRIIDFYARRIRRLLPASTCMLLATIVAAQFVFTPLEQEHLARTARSTAGYISNLWFMRQASDYFAQDTKLNPLLHTWSLAVEEQFYLVWPFLILLALRVRRSRSGLALVLVAASSASIASFIWLTKTNPPFAFFGMPARAWEFGLGGLASLVPSGRVHILGSASRFAGWIGLSAVLLSGCLLNEQTVFQYFGVLIPVLGTAAVLVAGSARSERGVSRLLGLRFLQELGRLSYSWYLWHWPVLVMALILFPALSVAGRSFCIVGSLGLAAMIHRAIENPIRFSPFLTKRPSLSVSLAVVSTILCLGISMLWQRHALRDPEDKVFAQAKNDAPRLYRLGCQADLTEAKLKECSFGDRQSSKTILLFGDSHAAQWFPPLERIASAKSWHLVTLTKSGCPAADVPIFNYQLGRSMPECTAWRKAALKRISELKPTLVVIGSSTIYLNNGPNNTGISESRWRDGTRETLLSLNSMGLQTLLIGNSPRMGFDVPICLSRLIRHRSLSCAVSRSVALPAGASKAEIQAAGGIDRVSSLELSDQICDNNTCPPVLNGMVLYRDADHLTASFAETLAPQMEVRITPLMDGQNPFPSAESQTSKPR